MTPHLRIAVIGNSLPRRCGIATFTTDLVRAIANSRPAVETCIVAMNDHGQTYDYPASVAFQIKDDTIDDYVRAASFLNAGRFDLVCLQHEFGIFGGEAGSHILELLSRLSMPVVTTLHTVLAKPSAAQRAVMERLEISSKIVVMASKGREMLRSVYDVADDKIEVIPHGIPEFPFVEPDAAKAKLGFGGRAVILTFGLLSPSKGIEVMIDDVNRRRGNERQVVGASVKQSGQCLTGAVRRTTAGCRRQLMRVDDALAPGHGEEFLLLRGARAAVEVFPGRGTVGGRLGGGGGRNHRARIFAGFAGRRRLRRREGR